VESPLFLFAHGAGAGSSHPWMQHWAALLKTLGRVQTFDYPYIERKERRPDPMPKLLAAHRDALATARHNGGSAIVLIGKSMGSRIGCHLAL
jgi:predicted alpha/beta-hydrolase family hydrolase